jgi:hypothetical protein
MAPVSLRNIRFTRTALLWLALLLALAQTAAIRHVYSHTLNESAAQFGGKHPGSLAQCETCIVAAALGGAAPPGPALPIAAAAQQAPLLPAPALQHIAPQQRQPYAIRAPPTAVS